jgi:hypothetical protein
LETSDQQDLPGLSRPDQSAVFAKVQGRSKQEAVDDSENKDSSADSDRLDATSEMHWKHSTVVKPKLDWL